MAMASGWQSDRSGGIVFSTTWSALTVALACLLATALSAGDGRHKLPIGEDAHGPAVGSIEMRVTLLPETPGPYAAGEMLKVSILLEHDWPFDPYMRQLRFDMAGSDPAIEMLAFSFDPMWEHHQTVCALGMCGFGHDIYGLDILDEQRLVAVTYTSGTPNSSTQAWFPHDELLHGGELVVVLPDTTGTYLLDVVNASTTDQHRGASYMNFTGMTDQPAWQMIDGTLEVRVIGDCNDNGLPDDCDIDCGEPGGACDLSGCGQSVDCDGNGVPDECEGRSGCCPPGAVVWIDPPRDVVDARYPMHPHTGEPLGIHRVVVSTAPGAIPNCWSLCESADTGSPNAIIDVQEDKGVYTLMLARPITPGACTKIAYTDDEGTTSMTWMRSHPGNVDADGIAFPGDVLSWIDQYNGLIEAPFGHYSGDIDHSGRIRPADILAIVDLLNGAGPFSRWFGSSLPLCAPCEP